MLQKEDNNIYKENENTKAPAPPIKPKKYIKYRIIHGPFRKTKTCIEQNNSLKNNNHKIDKKTIENFTSTPSNDDWSIFSPNFIDNSNKDKEIQDKKYIEQYKKNKMINKEKYHNKISKSVINIPKYEEEKLISLEKEINGLKETNQNILNLIMEKEKENKILINNIDKLKIESIDKLSNYLNYIEELGKKFKFSNDDEEEIYFDNSDEINELKNELNKNKQLKIILNKKNEEFSDINNAIKKLIFDNSLSFKESDVKINENILVSNINELYSKEDKNEENEIINIKNEYYKLKNDYNKLIEKFRKYEQKDKVNKNRIKFVYKDIPPDLKQKYEITIKELIKENQKIKNDYNKEIEELNISLGSKKVELLNKQFENETKLLNIKKKIKQMIKQCKEKRIKLNNEFINFK